MQQLTEIFFTLLENLFLYGMVRELFVSRYQGRKGTILFVLSIIIDTIFVYLCPITVITFRIIIFILFSMTLIHILYKNNILVKIFCILLVNYIFIISDMIAGNFISWVYKINVERLIFRVMSLPAISKMIAFALVLFFILLFKKIDFNIPSGYWVRMNIIVGAFIVISNFLLSISSTLQEEEAYYPAHMVQISLCFLLLSVFVIYLFGDICLFYQREQQRYALELKNKALEQQLAFQERSATELKKIRHDIKNNLINLSYLLKENHYEESIHYIEAITDTINATKMIIHCGNTYMDSILNYGLTVCKNNNINTILEIDTIPKLVITPTDLSSILSNLLNNAIEANLKITDDERYVSIKIFTYKNYLTIIIKNPYKHSLIEVEGMLTTNKGNKKYHGFGLKSVKSSIDKYGGEFRYSYEANVFTTMILFPLKLGANLN